MAEEIIFCGSQVVLEVAAGQGPQGPPGEFPEAPMDGKFYSRQNGAWVEVPDPSILTAPDGSRWRQVVDNQGLLDIVSA